MEPFYFGGAEQPLFGCYHGPESGLYRDCGVVICYPIGHEYIQCHRVFQQLAVRLSHQGFPVLRFDFFGCGDSGGACEDGEIALWQSDVSRAVDEIRRRFTVPRICLIGLRLGATMASMAGAQRRDIDAMVLWDPVVVGKDYLEELRDLHREMLQRSHVREKPVSAKEKQIEFLGFPFPDTLVADLERLNLLTVIQERPAEDVLLIESNERASPEAFEERLRGLAVRVERRHFSNPEFWTWIEDLTRVLVPYPILQSILSWISRVGA